MRTKKSYFRQKMGCLRLVTINLNRAIKANNLTATEELCRQSQDLLLVLVKLQRQLDAVEQKSVRADYANLRQEALVALENARHYLDDSLEFMLWLVKAAQDSLNNPAPTNRQT
jgi:hypothetical protein